MTVESNVEKIYSLLSKDPNFTSRPEQMQASIDIANCFLGSNQKDRTFILEAATGTGKTIAYLVGALVAKIENKVPVVISTGTKALQDQVFTNDLPKLVKAGVLSGDEVGLAKGKRNYLCFRNALSFRQDLEEAATEGETKYIPEFLYSVIPEELDEVIDAFDKKKWDGDFDKYKNVTSFPIQVLGVDSNNCTGGKCDYYERCAYFQKKKELATKSVLVTNHNYMLEDLKLAYGKDGQDDSPAISILPFEKYMLVTDEGHHLPQKALEIASSIAASQKIRSAFLKWNSAQILLEKDKPLQSKAIQLGYNNDVASKIFIINELTKLEEAVEALGIDYNKGYHRFPNDKVEKSVQDIILNISGPLNSLQKYMEALSSATRLIENPTMSQKELITRSGEILDDLKNWSRCLSRLTGATNYAKWVEKAEFNPNFELHACPIEGSVVLKPLLWESKKVHAVAVVSATLRDISGFQSFLRKCGLPLETKCKALESKFKYEDSEIVIPKMQYTPKQSERKKYVEELKSKLASFVEDEATLILFPSWALLKECSDTLRTTLGSRVRIQGDLPVKMLIEHHKQDTEKGKYPVLAGVATLSEGLDLPGDYCKHVIITAIPFASPADPVEEEIAERLGSEYFRKKSLPEAVIKLVQMIGRLLRRESDTGKITILDRRLATEQYGRQILSFLPNYKKIIEK